MPDPITAMAPASAIFSAIKRFVASPIVLWWSRGKGRNLRKEVLDASLAGEIEAAS